MMRVGLRNARIAACLLALSLSTSLSGCSAVILGAMANGGTDPASLKAATARFFNTSQSAVRISDVKKTPWGTGYKARVKGRTYNCGITFGAVDCKRPGG